MFCSAIIPTINRLTLSRSVFSVLNQEFSDDEFEIIVVNDTGQPLSDMEWQHSDKVRIITTQKRERSVARNTGAAVARGKYLYFLDDDDIMMPGALKAFWELSQRSEVAWLYGKYQIVNNDFKVIDEFAPDLTGNISAYLIAGEAIPFQTSILRVSDFYLAGEFDVYFTGAQDRDLGRRLSLIGEVAKTSALITQIRVGQINSSTDWSKLPEFDRLGREKALNQPGAINRLWDSARGNPYLHGRVSRALLASGWWNLKHKNIFTLLSRIVSFIICSLPYIFSSEFWEGLRYYLGKLNGINQSANIKSS